MKNPSNQTSIYAFAGWISSVFAYVAFLMWAFIPETYLNDLGITYYPSKYYAIALPAYVLVAYGFVNIMYVGLNMINTFDPSDPKTVRDPHVRYCDPKRIYGNNGQSQSQSSTINGTTGANVHGMYETVPEIGDIHPMEISRLRIK